MRQSSMNSGSYTGTSTYMFEKITGEGVDKVQKSPRVLQIASIDLAVRNLLLPLMKSLKKEGFIVDVAARKISDETVKEIERSGFKFLNIDIERNVRIDNIIRAASSINSVLRRNRYDIVHVHTPIAAFIGRLVAKMRNVPYIIYTAHGFYFHENMQPVKRVFYKTLEHLACRVSTDYLFCQSIEDTALASRDKFIAPERLIHIGNGVDIERFRPDIETSSIVRRELKIPPDAPVISYIGRMVRDKGIFDLIDAFRLTLRSHPDAVLILVGDSSSAMDRDQKTSLKLPELIAEYSLEKNIIMTGFHSRPEEILCASDIFVLPSYREGVPRTICEAMACGVPVIATDIRGPREQIADGDNGFLVPTSSPELLSKKINELIANRGLRLKMSERARKTAETLFDERKVIETQLQVYRKLAKSLVKSPE